MWERDEIKQENICRKDSVSVHSTPTHTLPSLPQIISGQRTERETNIVSFKTSIREISVCWLLISLVLVHSLESCVGEIQGPGLLLSLSQAVFQIKTSPEVNYGLSQYEHHWGLIFINLPILWLHFSLGQESKTFDFLFLILYIYIFFLYIYIYIYVFSVSDFIYIYTYTHTCIYIYKVINRKYTYIYRKIYIHIIYIKLHIIY